MITDPSALDPTIVPEHELIRHRDDELEELLQTLQPSPSGLPPSPVFITGPPGVGKSHLVKTVAHKLKLNEGVRVAETTGWDTSTRREITYQLGQQLLTREVHRQSTSPATVRDWLSTDPDHDRLVILDEADQLRSKDICYDIYEQPRMNVALIANTEEGIYAGMSDRVSSRMSGARHLEFDRYSVPQLADILWERVQYGLRPGVVSEDDCERIAQRVNGDARRGIKALQLAVQTADRETANNVTAEHIEQGIEDAAGLIRDSRRDRLTGDVETIYDLIVEHAPLSPGNLYDYYEQAVENPVSKKQVRTYRGKLVEYDMIRAEGSGPATTIHLND